MRAFETDVEAWDVVRLLLKANENLTCVCTGTKDGWVVSFYGPDELLLADGSEERVRVAISFAVTKLLLQYPANDEAKIEIPEV